MKPNCKMHKAQNDVQTAGERITFVKKADDLFMTGKTQKGKKISFVPMPESRLTFAQPDIEIIGVDYMGQDADNQDPTQLVLYCSFKVTMPMMDLLDSSGIISDLKVTNGGRQILAYPLPEFDYEKLKDLLIDLVIEFDL